MALSSADMAQTFVPPSAEELGFDPLELREKYAYERDKRMRSDGNNQYREMVDDLERLNVDPYIDKPLQRESLHENVDVVIVGGGFGGQLAAARLKQNGIENFRIIEKAGDLAAPGTGTDIPARSVTSSLTSICRCLKNVITFRKKNTRLVRRSSNTRSASVKPSNSTTARVSRPRLIPFVGATTTQLGA